MRFFLYEIVARIVAIILCVYCSRKTVVWPCREKIAYWNDDVVEWFLVDW
jgi:hypothetical protein